MTTETTTQPTKPTKPSGKIVPATAAFAWPTLPIDINRLLLVTRGMIAARVEYRLGAKAVPLSCDPSAIHAIDCSGFVRYALNRVSGVALPDGSVNQHDWVREKGFKKSSVESAAKEDGVIRIAFLSPADGGGVGHVVLIHGGETMESHGHKGVDRRAWSTAAHPFMAKCSVYVLTMPQGGDL